MSLPGPGAFLLNPLAVAAIAGTALLFGRAIARAAMPPAERRYRMACLGIALLLLGIALVSPIATLGAHYLLTAHLIENLLVMGVAPPLLVLSLPRQRAVRRVAGWRATVSGAALHPLCAIVCVNAAFFFWHAPAIYDASLRAEPLYTLQQCTLLVTSLQFWWPIAGPRRTAYGAPVVLGCILMATIPQTFAGLIVALAHHPFYTPYAAAPRVSGLSVMADQQVAGAGLALLSKVALFVAFSVIFWRLLSGNDTSESDDDGGAPSGSPPAPVPGLPVWVTLLNGATSTEPALRRRRSREHPVETGGRRP